MKGQVSCHTRLSQSIPLSFSKRLIRRGGLAGQCSTSTQHAGLTPCHLVRIHPGLSLCSYICPEPGPLICDQRGTKSVPIPNLLLSALHCFRNWNRFGPPILTPVTFCYDLALPLVFLEEASIPTFPALGHGGNQHSLDRRTRPPMVSAPPSL